MDIPEDFDIEYFADIEQGEDLPGMLGLVRISEMGIIGVSNAFLKCLFRIGILDESNSSIQTLWVIRYDSYVMTHTL